MDWRNRKYYCVSFDYSSAAMRLRYICMIDKHIKIHPYRHVEKQPTETEDRGHYDVMISVPGKCSEAVEYELRKAERNDTYCFWKEIKRDTSKKYFDIYGNEMPYRRCDIHPEKRCNHCMEC